MLNLWSMFNCWKWKTRVCKRRYSCWKKGTRSCRK